VSVSNTSKETSGTGAGADNGTNDGRGIDPDAVTGPCEEKYGMSSKNMTSADAKYFLLVGL